MGLIYGGGETNSISAPSKNLALDWFNASSKENALIPAIIGILVLISPVIIFIGLIKLMIKNQAFVVLAGNM